MKMNLLGLILGSVGLSAVTTVHFWNQHTLARHALARDCDTGIADNCALRAVTHNPMRFVVLIVSSSDVP